MTEPHDVPSSTGPAAAETVPVLPELQLEVAALSEKGPRDENQDALGRVRSPRGELFIVADGMGGYKGGAYAARLTVERVEQHIVEAPLNMPFARVLEEAVALTNREIHQIAHSGDSDTENMGSTVVVALVSDGKVQVGHVGDSRAYLFREGRLRLLTRDHTRVQQMVDARMITAKQARNHPDGHVLTRAVGSSPEVEVEIGRPIRLKAGDALLMCSDGLSGFVSDKTIRAVLQKQANVQRVPQRLVAKALACGGSDNITIQYVRFGSAIRQRWTAKLPAVPERAAPASVPDRTTPGWRPRVAAAAVVLIAAAALIPYTLAYPRIEFNYLAEPDATRDVVLRWSAPRADELRIEPGLGADPVPTIGTARVSVPVGAPVTYKATATARLWWWTLVSEETVTIQPAGSVQPVRAADAKDGV